MTDFFPYFITGLVCFVAGMLVVVAMDKVATEDEKYETKEE